MLRAPERILYCSLRPVIVCASIFCASIGVSLPAQAPPQSQGPAAISPGFLEKEKSARHDFLIRHPVTLPGPFAKYAAAASEEDLFPLAFATAMQSTAESPQHTDYAPGYWRNFVITNLPILPLGDYLGALYLRAGLAGHQRQEDEAVNRHALETLRALKLLVVRMEVSDAAAFDSATPAAKSKSILAALRKYSDLLDYPCPYSIYLLDADKTDEDPDHRVAREFVRHLNGSATADYTNFPIYSREQQTEALRRAFNAFVANGSRVAGSASAQDLDSYLHSLGFTLDHQTDIWKLSDNSRELLSDRLIIRRVFGQDVLHHFEAETDGTAKDETRIAAILLFTQLNVLASGLLIG